MAKEENFDEMTQAAIRFLRSFEFVFHYDWDYTRSIIDHPGLEDITFLETGWEDNDNDIKCLSGLLSDYRDFVKVLKAHGVEPTIPDPPGDDYAVNRTYWPRAWRDSEAWLSDASAKWFEEKVRQFMGEFAEARGFKIESGQDAKRERGFVRLQSDRFLVDVDRSDHSITVGLVDRPEVSYSLSTLIQFLSKSEDERRSASFYAEANLLMDNADRVLDRDMLISAELKDWLLEIEKRDAALWLSFEPPPL